MDRRLPHRIQLGVPGIYQDNLWRLPVALSNNVGLLGTTLIGAFDSACRMYSR